MTEKEVKGAFVSAQILMFSAVEFVVLTLVAMFLYPGGSKFDMQSTHYLFLHNFFSDLGGTISPSGLSNLASSALFFVALTCTGTSLIFFSRAWKTIVWKGNQGAQRGTAAQFFGILSGLGFIGVACTPWNLAMTWHNIFVRVAFGSLMIFMAFLTTLQVKNRWSRTFIVLNTIYVLLLIGYLYILFFAPTLNTEGGLVFRVATQKIIVYVSILNMGVQALGIRQFTLRHFPHFSFQKAAGGGAGVSAPGGQTPQVPHL